MLPSSEEALAFPSLSCPRKIKIATGGRFPPPVAYPDEKVEAESDASIGCVVRSGYGGEEALDGVC